MTEKEFSEAVGRSLFEQAAKGVQFERVTLTKERIMTTVPVADYVLKLKEPEVRSFVEMLSNRLIVTFMDYAYTQKLEVHDVEIPDGIWQTVKERYIFSWIPWRLAWKLSDWRILTGVRYRVHKFEAKAIYPGIEGTADKIEIVLQVKKLGSEVDGVGYIDLED